MKIITFTAFLLYSVCGFGQQTHSSAAGSEQVYTISYDGSSDDVSIDIRLPKAQKGPVQLIIPRSAPGDYRVSISKQTNNAKS